MDEMPSSEFRRRYATLTEQTMVTVLGRAIGYWTPRNVEVWREMDAQPGFRERMKIGLDQIAAGDTVPFNSRPFTPAPKK
jgi:hypothetical protein